MPDIHAIYRYPIKGLSPELLLRAELLPHETIPGDRLYAIENGLSSFNPAAPGYLSKTHFLMLMKNERLVFLFWPAGNAQTLFWAASPSPHRPRSDRMPLGNGAIDGRETLRH